MFNFLQMEKKYKTLWKEMPPKWKKIFLLNSYYFEKMKSLNRIDLEKLYEEISENFVEEGDLEKLLEIEEFICSEFYELAYFPELLFKLPNLRKLNLSWNKKSDISPLLNLKNLKKLTLSKNTISDTSILKKFPKSVHIDL